MKKIGIYPVSGQPPTRAHFQTYKKLKQIVGNNDTFISTTDKNPTPDAPLNFGDKEQIWVRYGVPSSHVMKIQDWKNPIEIFNQFSPVHTSVVFALNQKEIEEIVRRKRKITKKQKSNNHLNLENEEEVHEEKEMWLTSEGKPNYFQPYLGNEDNMESLSKHGYVLLIDDSRIEGKPVTTANIRQVLGSPVYNDDKKKLFFKFIFGWFDIGLYFLITSKFQNAHQVSLPPENVNGDNHQNIKQKVQQMVYEILGEMMETTNEDYTSGIMGSGGGSGSGSGGSSMLNQTQQTNAQKSKQASQNRIELVKKKQETEREIKGMKDDLTWKKQDVIRKRKDELPNARKQLDMINKQISSLSNPNAVV